MTIGIIETTLQRRRLAIVALFNDSCTLSRLIGRPTTPMSTTISATLLGA